MPSALRHAQRQRSAKRKRIWHWAPEAADCVEALEQEADSLARTTFDVGHLAIGVALAYLDFRFDSLKWREDHPKLAAWHATFDARPSCG